MAQTETAVQEHLVYVEMEDGECGYRWWSEALTDAEASEYVAANEARGNFVSEYSCMAGCECLSQP